MKIVPFEKKHIIPLLEQNTNKQIKDVFTDFEIERMVRRGSETILIKDVPAVCGGVVEMWPGRGHLWTVFNEDFKRNFRPVFKAMEVYLEQKLCTFHRIEISIPYDLIFAKRRAEMLGFTLEVERARKFHADKSDATLYSMVRD